MTAARVGMIVAAVALSFAAGRWQSPVEVTVAPPAAPRERAVMTSAGSQLTVDDVRAAVRDELSRTAGVTPPACESGNPDPGGEREPGAPASEPFREAQSIVAAAVGRARWTYDDARALRDVLRTLDPHENRQVTRALYTAANAGHLVVETGGPLLAAYQGDRP